jgi:hypothetical protein
MEYDIAVLEAEALMQLRQGPSKKRCVTSSRAASLPRKSMFSGETHGLVIAEIELRTSISASNCRPGLARGKHRAAVMLQQSLVQRPFHSWSREETRRPFEGWLKWRERARTHGDRNKTPVPSAARLLIATGQ